MTPREIKYHWKKAYIRKIERGLVPYPKIVHLPSPVNNLRYRIIPREEILEHIFDLTFGKTSEN